MAKRRKFKSAYGEVIRSLRHFERLDDQNQARATQGPGRPAAQMLSPSQVFSLSETAFFAAFRSLENFVEECFVLYTMGKPNLSSVVAKSFLSSQEYDRNRGIIKSGSKILDWNSPETVIQRAEVFLKDGEPVKRVFEANADLLRRMTRIRNHIAHNSEESIRGFRKVVRQDLGVLPVRFPSAGEFLEMRNARITQSSFLRHYLDEMRMFAHSLSH